MPRLHLHLSRTRTGAHVPFFDDVARMIHGAAAELGVESTQGHESGPGLNVVLGTGEMAEQARVLPEATVLYTFEQHAVGSRFAHPAHIDYLAPHRLWSYDPLVTKRLWAKGLRPLTVPVGYTAAWETMKEADEDLDVAFFGCDMGQRPAIIEALRGAGLKVAWEPGFGEARDRIYARAKVCLSLASYQPPILQSLRIGYLLVNRRCVLSDTFMDPEAYLLGPEAYPYASAIETVAPERIVERALELVASSSLRWQITERGHEAFKAFPYAAGLAAALRVECPNGLRPHPPLRRPRLRRPRWPCR